MVSAGVGIGVYDDEEGAQTINETVQNAAIVNEIKGIYSFIEFDGGS